MSFDLGKALEILSNKLQDWLESLTAMLPNMVVAMLALILFYLLARIIRRASAKLLNRISEKSTINTLFSNIIYLFIVGIGLMVALNILHLEQTVTSLLAGAGIIGLALGFAFQDISANFISGIFMAFRRPIEVGDIIETRNFFGTVEKIDLRVTIIRTFQGLHVLIPNREVFQNPLINYTKTDERRIDLEVGISYREDLETVRTVALEAINKLDFLLPGKEANVFFKEFGDSSINFMLNFWIHYPDEPGFLNARSEAVIAIKKAFDQNGITIPFPIRTLEFDKDSIDGIFPDHGKESVEVD